MCVCVCVCVCVCFASHIVSPYVSLAAVWGYCAFDHKSIELDCFKIVEFINI